MLQSLVLCQETHTPTPGPAPAQIHLQKQIWYPVPTVLVMSIRKPLCATDHRIFMLNSSGGQGTWGGFSVIMQPANSSGQRWQWERFEYQWNTSIEISGKSNYLYLLPIKRKCMPRQLNKLNILHQWLLIASQETLNVVKCIIYANETILHNLSYPQFIFKCLPFPIIHVDFTCQEDGHKLFRALKLTTKNLTPLWLLKP